MQLETYIADLLHRHDCVIVPDFGGFVANYKAAEIDKIRKKIYPPSKSVLFNPNLTTNDGLLGNYVARQEETDYPQALNLIAEKVEKWKVTISEGERVEIGEIGFLYQENGKVQLEQSRDVNLLLEAYGLSAIDFVSFKEESKSTFRVQSQRESVKEVKTVVSDSNMIEEETHPKEELTEEPSKSGEKKPAKTLSQLSEKYKKKQKGNHNPKKAVKKPIEKEQKKNRTIALSTNKKPSKEKAVQEKTSPSVARPKRFVTVLKYAAAAAFVPVLFYSYWIPMETDALETKSIQFSDFNPIHKQSEKVYEKRTESIEFIENENPSSWGKLTGNIQSSVYSYELTEDFYVPILLNENESEKSSSTHQQIAGNSNYHLISGCFSIKNNALSKIETLQSSGFPATILDKSKGLHRVTAGGYNSRGEAENALSKLKGAGFSAWILKQ